MSMMEPQPNPNPQMSLQQDAPMDGPQQPPSPETQDPAVNGLDPAHVQSLILQQMGLIIAKQMESMSGEGSDPFWNLDVYSKTLDTLASAFDKLELNNPGMTGEQEFELEGAKQQFEMNLKVEDFGMKREMHELEMEIRQAEAAEKIRIQRQQADLKMELDREAARTAQATAAANALLQERKQSKELEIKETQAQQAPKPGTS